MASERALLACLLAKIHKYDPDLIVVSISCSSARIMGSLWVSIASVLFSYLFILIDVFAFLFSMSSLQPRTHFEELECRVFNIQIWNSFWLGDGGISFHTKLFLIWKVLHPPHPIFVFLSEHLCLSVNIIMSFINRDMIYMDLSLMLFCTASTWTRFLIGQNLGDLSGQSCPSLQWVLICFWWCFFCASHWAQIVITVNINQAVYKSTHFFMHRKYIWLLLTNSYYPNYP